MGENLLDRSIHCAKLRNFQQAYFKNIIFQRPVVWPWLLSMWPENQKKSSSPYGHPMYQVWQLSSKGVKDIEQRASEQRPAVWLWPLIWKSLANTYQCSLGASTVPSLVTFKQRAQKILTRHCSICRLFFKGEHKNLPLVWAMKPTLLSIFILWVISPTIEQSTLKIQGILKSYITNSFKGTNLKVMINKAHWENSTPQMHSPYYCSPQSFAQSRVLVENFK